MSNQEQKHEHRKFVIHVGNLKLPYEESEVSASRILEDAGATPTNKFILEATQGASGTPVAEFEAKETVDLSQKHREHFRAVPKGGGRS